jgi:hypothetical protein
MKFNALNKRMAALEKRARPRMIATLADFVVWRAKNGGKELWKWLISIQF